MPEKRIPQSADLRSVKFAIRDCDRIGPSTLKAIAASIQDVRQKSSYQTSIDPTPLFIHYGEMIIAGFAPQVAKARWPCGANTNSRHAGHLAYRDETPDIRVASSGISDTLGKRNSASSMGANDFSATGALDNRLQVAPVTLCQLKASLAEGHLFSFLFLHHGGSAAAVHPRTGDKTRAVMADLTAFYAVTVVGYDDQQEVFLVVKQAVEASHEDGEIMVLSYSYWTHPVLSQDVWTIWKSKPQICAKGIAK